jgi:hypothetical protein
MEELQAQSTQHIPSTTKVKGGQESATQDADARNGPNILEVQKEPESTSRQSMKSA